MNSSVPRFRIFDRARLTAFFAGVVAALFIATGNLSAQEPAPAQQPASAQLPGYLLNPGDVLQIAVWKDDALSRTVLVLPDGKISFPLVGFLDAAGKTAEDVQKVVTEKLAAFVTSPVVTISVTSVPGNRIYVIGKVKVPGSYPVTSEVDVMQALSLAGGLTPFAAEDAIQILRRENGKQRAIRFEYSEVSEGKKLEEMNIPLKSGDVVVVP